jgi:protein-arginine kinase activator protein McsA
MNHFKKRQEKIRPLTTAEKVKAQQQTRETPCPHCGSTFGWTDQQRQPTCATCGRTKTNPHHDALRRADRIP